MQADLLKSNEKLTLREQRFILEYLLDGNCSRAATAAGYERRRSQTTAKELLKKPKIKQIIDRLCLKSQKDFEISRYEILWNLWACAVRNGKQFVDEKGKLLLTTQNINDLPDEITAAIDSIKQKRRTWVDLDGVDHEEIETEIKLMPKAQALEMCMKHKGLFAAEEVKTTVSVDDETFRRFLQEMHVPLVLDVDPIEQKILSVSSKE